MSLDAYKLDKAFTEGVDIRLDRAPDDVFRVKLPSQYNRGYTSAVYGSLKINVDGDGARADGSIIGTRHAQEDAFVEHCVVSLNGDPLPGNFMAEYPEAVTELMEKASELASEVDNRVGETVKKSPASLTGSENGQARKGSTGGSKRQAG
jgi:hypothetical protein